MGSKNKKIALMILACLLIAGSLFINGNSRNVTAGTSDVYENIEIFAEVLRQIEENYVEPQDPQKLIYGAIKGMVQSLDPHSSFGRIEDSDGPAPARTGVSLSAVGANRAVDLVGDTASGETDFEHDYWERGGVFEQDIPRDVEA